MKPKYSVNDRIKGNAIWVEPEGLEYIIRRLEQLGATWRPKPEQPGFAVVQAILDGKPISGQNAVSLFKAWDELELISFDEALRIRDEKRKGGQQQ